jgi:hypothetical protein
MANSVSHQRKADFPHFTLRDLERMARVSGITIIKRVVAESYAMLVNGERFIVLDSRLNSHEMAAIGRALLRASFKVAVLTMQIWVWSTL